MRYEGRLNVGRFVLVLVVSVVAASLLAGCARDKAPGDDDRSSLDDEGEGDIYTGEQDTGVDPTFEDTAPRSDDPFDKDSSGDNLGPY